MIDNGANSVLSIVTQLAVVVAKAHIAILDGALLHAQLCRAGLVLHVGRRLKHLVHALKPGNGLLVHLGRVDERLERRAK